METRQDWIGTKVLIALSVAVFVADLLFDHRIIVWGAVSHAIWAGEWHRLVAPHFIHSGVPHILFNMYALYIFGRLVEGMIGTGRFLVVYFVGGIAGFLVSLLARPQGLAVGASAAIFALMGFTLHYRLRRLPKRWLSIDSAFAQILGLNLILGFTVPNIDQFAHLGGLVGGALAGSLVGLPRPWFDYGWYEYDVDEESPDAPVGGDPSTTGMGPWAVRRTRRKPRHALDPLWEKGIAVILLVALGWAGLSPLTFARATGAPEIQRFAAQRYGKYFTPFVATDFALVWLPAEDPGGDWRPLRQRLDRRGSSPVALGLFWRWVAGGGKEASGEYAVYWLRYNARTQEWQTWHVDRGRVDQVDREHAMVYRRGLVVESQIGEFDGRWRVSVEVDGHVQYDREFFVSPAL